jgi:hypothetical protein
LTTAQDSIAIGYQSLFTNQTANYNIAIGGEALYNTTGEGNIAVGVNSLKSNTTGQNNIAIGREALFNNTTGGSNIVFGADGMRNNTTGGQNIALRGLGRNVSGSYNIGLLGGNYETGDRNFYVNLTPDNDFGSLNADRSGSLMWGVGNTVTSGQTLQINASTTVTNNLTVVSGSNFFAHGHKQFNCGGFQSNTTQSGSANVSQSITFDTTDVSHGVSIVSGSRITFANAGVYSTTFSLQIDTNSGSDTIWSWLKKNGTNVPETATKMYVLKDESAVMTVNFMNELAANDYLEIVWQNNAGNGILLYEAASGNIPVIPSAVVTTSQVR